MTGTIKLGFHAAEKGVLKTIELQRIKLYPLLISVGIFLTFDNVVVMSFHIIHDTLITNL